MKAVELSNQPLCRLRGRKIPGDVGEGLRFLHPSWCGNLRVGTESSQVRKVSRGQWEMGRIFIPSTIHIYIYILYTDILYIIYV